MRRAYAELFSLNNELIGEYTKRSNNHQVRHLCGLTCSRLAFSVLRASMSGAADSAEGCESDDSKGSQATRCQVCCFALCHTCRSRFVRTPLRSGHCQDARRDRLPRRNQGKQHPLIVSHHRPRSDTARHSIDTRLPLTTSTKQCTTKEPALCFTFTIEVQRQGDHT
jgi:hypothetical protein